MWSITCGKIFSKQHHKTSLKLFSLKVYIKSATMEKHDFENRDELKLKSISTSLDYPDSNTKTGINSFAVEKLSKSRELSIPISRFCRRRQAKPINLEKYKLKERSTSTSTVVLTFSDYPDSDAKQKQSFLNRVIQHKQQTLD